MIKNEWKSLWHNKFMLIVVVAIIAIPLIYAGLFLKSMWDPYGSVENLPVAVVNNDKSVEYEGKTLQVGDDLVDELKDNDSLAFNFVDADVAEQGLKNGTFYMVITIPEDFSKNASTLMDEHPKKMQLTYKTNPGTNYIASKMSETALTKIKTSVAAEVTKTYSETVFDQIGTIGDGMQDAADGSLELKEGIDTAADGADTIATNLNTLADGAGDLKDGADKLGKGVKDYTDGAAKINKGAKTLLKGTKTLKDGTDTLATKGKTYTDGVTTLADGVTAYVSGAEQLAAGASQLAPLESLGDVSNGISQLNTAVTKGTDEQTSLVAGTTVLKEGIGKMQKEVEGAAGTLGNLSESLTKAASTIQQASDGIDTANKGIEKVVNAATKGSTILENGVQVIKGTNNAIGASNQQVADANVAIQSAITVLEDAKKNGANVDDQIAELKKISVKKINEVDATTIQQLAAGANQISDGLTTAATQLNAVPGQLQPAIDGLNDGATALSAANPAASMTALNEGLKTVYTGATALETGAKQVSAGLQQLETATAAFPTAAAGIKALNAGFATLTANDEKLTQGAAALKTNTPAVTEGIQSLATGATQLNTGAASLLTGTKQLTANNKTLISGVSQLSSGATQIADGSTKLYDGSLDLTDGMTKLQDGAKELHDGIKDGADEVKEINTNDETYEMFAEPVEDKETKITKVENNGHAMAPYMMSVGLWVGCLAFCLIYPLMSFKGELKSGLAWWASKATVLYPVAILQGAVLILALNKLAGFHPVEFGKTVAFACLTAVAFTSIMYFFNIWLGKVGSFLMLVFMVVQLAGSAGTYPVELSPSFVSKIHDLVPFTYTVNAFRSTICGGKSIATSVKVLVILTVIFTAATIVSFHFKGIAKKQGKVLPYDWLEERGLA